MKQSPTPQKPRTADVVKALVTRACCIFTGIAAFLLVFQWLMEQALEKSIAAELFLMLLPLSLCISGAGLIRKTPRLAAVTKVVLHPLLCLGGLLLVYIPYMISNHFPAVTAMVHLSVFTVCYGIVTAVLCLVSSAKQKKTEKETPKPYESQFYKN